MLTAEFLSKYFVEPGKLPKHQFYDRSVYITNKLEAHSKGIYPAEIIEMARPNETQEQKDYRKSAFTPVTKTYFSKVVSTVTKISRAEDWSVKFPEQTDVSEDETLEDYTCENYPSFDSLLNWFFSLQIREMCDDPNGVIAVFPYPKLDPNNDAEFLRPFTFWFESEDVIDYKEGKYAVLRSAEKTTIRRGDKLSDEGLVYYVFDIDSWVKCKQVGEKDDYRFELEGPFPHNIGSLPCFKIGGIIEEFKEGEMLYDSFVGDCLPFWDEALRRYSDQQVQMVLHVHSEKWEIEDTPCKTCKGSGSVMTQMGGKNHSVTCSSCYGSGGGTARGPFNVKMIKVAQKSGPTESITVPTPPMGYIPKPIEETKFIHDQVYENIKNGLAAINMEFLMNEPELNSGIAKTLDRQEMNTFFYVIARHIVKNILDPCYYFIAKWRYGRIYSEEQIMAILPEIRVPVKFDLLNEDLLIQRVSNAKTAGLSPGFMSEMERELAKKEFGEDSIQVQMLDAISQLDPLPNKDDQSKMTVLSNKGTTLQKYILSCNIQAFINRAVAENDDFFDMTYSDKMDILNGYVQEIIDNQEQAKRPVITFQMPASDQGQEPNPNVNPGGAAGSGDPVLDAPENQPQIIEDAGQD